MLHVCEWFSYATTLTSASEEVGQSMSPMRTEQSFTTGGTKGVSNQLYFFGEKINQTCPDLPTFYDA